MSNLSYCRFENTLRDLKDCYEHLFDELETQSEIAARDELIEICGLILNEWEGK